MGCFSQHHRPSRHLPPILAAAIALAFFFSSVTLHRKITGRWRTVPTDPKPPFPLQRFPFSLLRRATDSFSAANCIGQGGFGSVYKGILPSGQEIAVKLMSEASTHGEREFHNELSLASIADTAVCPYFVCVLGFSTSKTTRDYKSRCYGRRKKTREGKLALVYEYMRNGSMQDALLDRKCAELMHWNKRFAMATSIAKGLLILDHVLNNREEEMVETCIKDDEKKTDKKKITEDDVVTNVEQPWDDSAYCVRIIDGGVNVGVLETPPFSEEISDRASVGGQNRKWILGREKREDWLWKQEITSGLPGSGRAKDYVMESTGSEINKESPKKGWIIKSKSSVEGGVVSKVVKEKKKLEWWASLDKNERKDRKPREWWKEEFRDELSKKNKKRVSDRSKNNREEHLCGRNDEDGDQERKNTRRSRGMSRTSIDQWLDVGSFIGEFRINDISRNGGISSMPSARGTVCYAAPKYGNGVSPVSDKCDVYSFGVLLLVMVSGRRPLQVRASSGMLGFKKVNLISWARQLALNGKMADLVDTDIESVDCEQAVMCVTIALLCLQRSPDKRPTMREIVEMLVGKSS
ncbi:hypothetical protein OROGR_029986 [Orobanche gracilis]